MSIQQNQIVQPTYNGQDIYYRTPVDAIITDGMSLDDYIRNTTGVVESGSNANGNYVKFADGTMICQGSKTFTSVACTTAYGGLYRSNAGNQMNDFPVEFYNIPIVHFGVTEGSASGNNSNAGPIVIVFLKTNTDSTNIYVPTKTNPGRISIAVAASQTISSVTVSYTAIGRWKDYDVSVLPDQQQSTIINSSSTNYSYDEKVIGLWADNKPHYRSVIKLTSLPAADTAHTLNIANLNIDRCTLLRGWTYSTTFGYIDLYFYNNNNFNRVHTKNGTGFDVIEYLYHWTASEITFVLEYTKKSDQPITSQTKDLLTVVNGKNITDLETIIQQRIDQLLENKLKERKVATAKMDSNKTFSANVKYTMDSIISNTDKLTLSSGGIRIGAGITQVLVSAQAFDQASSNSGYLWTAIKKNSTNVSICISSPSSYYSSNAHSPVLIDVVEGDIIYLYDIGSTATGTIRSYPNTYLTVEIVKEQG